MKKMTIFLILALITLRLSAPSSQCLYIEKSTQIKTIDLKLLAFYKVESDFRTKVINSLGYRGILQEGQEIVNEANKINARNGNSIRYTINDCLDSAKATSIWYIIQGYWNQEYNLRKAAKIWNPLASPEYYRRILKYYYKLKNS
jgi:hypothetical protein